MGAGRPRPPAAPGRMAALGDPGQVRLLAGGMTARASHCPLPAGESCWFSACDHPAPAPETERPERREKVLAAVLPDDAPWPESPNGQAPAAAPPPVIRLDTLP